MRTDSTWRAVEHDARTKRGLGPSPWEWMRAQVQGSIDANAIACADVLAPAYVDASTRADVYAFVAVSALADADAIDYADAGADAGAYAAAGEVAAADADVER